MVKQIDKKVAKGAIERIADLERTNIGLIQALNQLMNQSNERFNNTAEVLGAVVEKVGAAEIQQLVEEKRSQRASEQVERAEKFLETEVSAGRLAATDTIVEGSMIVGVEYTAEGTPVPPGRVQIPFSSVLPDLQSSLLGKSVGTRVTTSGNTTFEVLEIYDAVINAAAAPTASEVVDVEAMLSTETAEG